MKLLFQGVRAVSVELLGVILIVWPLLNFASWGMRNTADWISVRSELHKTPISARIDVAPVEQVGDQNAAIRTDGLYPKKWAVPLYAVN